MLDHKVNTPLRRKPETQFSVNGMLFAKRRMYRSLIVSILASVTHFVPKP